MFAARRNRQNNPLHPNHGGGPGTGGFPLACRQPHADRAIPDANPFGDVAEAAALRPHAGDVVKVYDTGGAAKSLPVASGVLESRPHPLLD